MAKINRGGLKTRASILSAKKSPPSQEIIKKAQEHQYKIDGLYLIAGKIVRK